MILVFLAPFVADSRMLEMMSIRLRRRLLSSISVRLMMFSSSFIEFSSRLKEYKLVISDWDRSETDRLTSYLLVCLGVFCNRQTYMSNCLTFILDENE